MKNILEEFEVFENDATESEIAAATLNDDVTENDDGVLEYIFNEWFITGIDNLTAFFGHPNVVEIVLTTKAFDILLDRLKIQGTVAFEAEEYSVVVRIDECAKVRFVSASEPDQKRKKIKLVPNMKGV